MPQPVQSVGHIWAARDAEPSRVDVVQLFLGLCVDGVAAVLLCWCFYRRIFSYADKWSSSPGVSG